METPIGDDEDSNLGDFIEDTVIESPLENATDESLHFATDDVLSELIGMNTDHTLEEVGKQFDVTRERIRQIEAKALRKLRHPARSSHLRSIYGKKEGKSPKEIKRMEMMKKKEAHMKKEMERWGRWKPEDCKKVSEASGTFLYFAGESMKEGEKHEKMGHQEKADLTAREAKVLRMRFGIGMNTDHTLEEVGKQFDVTRERIRQIEAKALRKLRHPARSSHLRSFLDD